MELIPKSVGELLSDGLSLLRRHLGALVVVALPFAAVELVVRDAMMAALATLSGTRPDTPLAELGERLLPAAALGSALFFALVVVTQLLALSVTTMTAGALLGQSIDPVAAARGALKKLAQVAWTSLLFFLTIALVGALLPALAAVVFVAFTLDPVLAVVAALAWGAWLAVVFIVLGLRWALWSQVLALEGLSGWRGLRRSKALMGPPGVRLTQNPKFRLSLLFFIYFVAQSAVQQLFLLPLMIRGLGQAPPFSDMSLWSMPLYWAVPLALCQVASNSVVMPLNAVLATSFYFDVRVRYEGFDLDVKP